MEKLKQIKPLLLRYHVNDKNNSTISRLKFPIIESKCSTSNIKFFSRNTNINSNLSTNESNFNLIAAKKKFKEENFRIYRNSCFSYLVRKRLNVQPKIQKSIVIYYKIKDLDPVDVKEIHSLDDVILIDLFYELLFQIIKNFKNQFSGNNFNEILIKISQILIILLFSFFTNDIKIIIMLIIYLSLINVSLIPLFYGLVKNSMLDLIKIYFLILSYFLIEEIILSLFLDERTRNFIIVLVFWITITFSKISNYLFNLAFIYLQKSTIIQ